MPENPPRVYILYGEDEYTLALAVSEIESRLGDSALADLNITRIEGRSSSLEDLRLLVSSVPFFVSRRLVIVTGLLPKIETARLKDKFLDLLAALPATTALVLIEHQMLKDGHWLLSWAANAGSIVYARSYPKLKGDAINKWIESQVSQLGGKISRRAAILLASLVGDDTRTAYNEIQKLLAYTGYKRTIEQEDVEMLVISISQADIFEFVDSIGNRDNRKAMSVLRRLCETVDQLHIFYMIVRQIRLVLMAKEILVEGSNERDVARLLHQHPYVAGKISTQARNFSFENLEKIYRRLLSLDVAVKTGLMNWDLAMEGLVAEFS